MRVFQNGRTVTLPDDGFRNGRKSLTSYIIGNDKISQMRVRDTKCLKQGFCQCHELACCFNADVSDLSLAGSLRPSFSASQSRGGFPPQNEKSELAHFDFFPAGSSPKLDTAELNLIPGCRNTHKSLLCAHFSRLLVRLLGSSSGEPQTHTRLL